MKMLNTICFVALLFCVSVAGSSASAQGTASTTGPTFTQNLTLGSRGDNVSALQQFLIAGGFLKIPTPTAYFGSLTRAALSAWQASVDISPSFGFFGPLSRGRMNALASQAPIVATTTVATTMNVAVTTNEDGSPMRLIIPKLNVVTSFQYLGLTPDGTMEIPNNITDVGWFTGSVRPGEKGVSIITGHVAQIRGGILTKPGVFYALNELRPGEKLYVLNDKGESRTFVVRESRLYDPVADATDVFTSNDDGAHLNFITCEGTWNQEQLSYSKRLVVFTDAAQ